MEWSFFNYYCNLFCDVACQHESTHNYILRWEEKGLMNILLKNTDNGWYYKDFIRYHRVWLPGPTEKPAVNWMFRFNLPFESLWIQAWGVENSLGYFVDWGFHFWLIGWIAADVFAFTEDVLVPLSLVINPVFLLMAQNSMLLFDVQHYNNIISTLISICFHV